MNKNQREIICYLIEKGTMRGVPKIAERCNLSDHTVMTELDILSHNEFVNVVKSPSNKIKRAEVTEKGKNFYYNTNQLTNKEGIQEQLNEMKEAVELLNQLLNTNSTKERKDILDKTDRIQSVLNGGIQLVSSISKLL